MAEPTRTWYQEYYGDDVKVAMFRFHHYSKGLRLANYTLVFGLLTSRASDVGSLVAHAFHLR